MMADNAIHVEELTYAYARGVLALDRVSFDVAAGECVGLVGPNGAGKTTLFLCLAGVYGRRGGTVRVAGLDPGRKEERGQLPAPDCLARFRADPGDVPALSGTGPRSGDRRGTSAAVARRRGTDGGAWAGGAVQLALTFPDGERKNE